MSNKKDSMSFVKEAIEGDFPIFRKVAEEIWNLAETKFEEVRSARLQADLMRENGFTVTEGIAGIPTAFMAEYGEGGPVIAMLGEYDALDAMSQKPALPEKQAIVEGEAGHGCGHHILGTAGALAAVAARKYLEAKGIPGRVRYYGCPAEEGGNAKTFMVREGLFGDVDVALSWHPGTLNAVMAVNSLAYYQTHFHFRGIASHAGTSPHLGRSALDAVELMNVGVNYLREHVPQSSRIHYAITNAGGAFPNIVQSSASVLYLVRSPSQTGARDIIERVQKIAQGAALMTGTTVEWKITTAAASFLGNDVLEGLYEANLAAVDAPDFDDEDIRLARAFKDTFSAADIAESFDQFELVEDPDLILHRSSLQRGAKRLQHFFSTDVADVSRVIPTAQFYGACYAIGTPFHSWQMVAQGMAPAAMKGMKYAANVIASTALDLFGDPSLVEAAKKEFRMRSLKEPYECPIPPDVMPALPSRQAENAN